MVTSCDALSFLCQLDREQSSYLREWLFVGGGGGVGGFEAGGKLILWGGGGRGQENGSEKAGGYYSSKGGQKIWVRTFWTGGGWKDFCTLV